MKTSLHKLSMDELREKAVALGANKRQLYGTSKDSLIITISRLERLGGSRFLQLQDAVRHNLTEAQQRGENNMMLSFRLSGMIQGLQIANELNDQQAVEIIIAMKNEFNF